MNAWACTKWVQHINSLATDRRNRIEGDTVGFGDLIYHTHAVPQMNSIHCENKRIWTLPKTSRRSEREQIFPMTNVKRLWATDLE